MFRLFRILPLPLLLLLAFVAGLGAARVVARADARTDATSAIGPRTPLAGAYRAQVTQVLDGDTLEARVHVWMGQEALTRVRLAGIDAPERGGACAEERALAQNASARLARLIGEGPVTLTEVRPDKYFGRVVARVITANGTDAGAVLLGEGMARASTGRSRKGWC
jgi:endonuclease YncB( thermonuclease family)